MAQVRSYDDGKVRISTSLTYNRVKAIPDLNLPSLHRNHSAGSKSIASVINPSADPFERFELPGIPSHEPCFVTKRPGYSLGKIYLVKTPKDDNSKSAVHRFLLCCHIVPTAFSLNCPSNVIRLDLTLKHALDKLGFIAITCSKATLSAILKIVKEENRVYDESLDYRRVFSRNKPPFSNAEYELVVLHPDHFLPVGSTMASHTEDPDDPSCLIGKLYMIGEDGALREGRASTSPRFPAFRPSHLRKDIDRVNPLLVALNADMVFRRFRRLGDHFMQRLCPEYAELVDLTTQLVDAIYHPPIAQGAAHTYSRYFPPYSEDSDTSQDDSYGIWDSLDPSNSRQSRCGVSAGGADRKSEAFKYSRFGKEVHHPGPDASYEEFRDFYRYIISGRDVPLNSHDEAILKATGLYPDCSDDEDNRPDDKEDNRCTSSGASVAGFGAQDLKDKVSQWQNSCAEAADV